MTEWKAGDHAMVEIAGGEGSLAVVKYPGGTVPIPASALHPLPPPAAASAAALADATEKEADAAYKVCRSHVSASRESFLVALNNFINRRRVAIPETTRKESLRVPSTATFTPPEGQSPAEQIHLALKYARYALMHWGEGALGLSMMDNAIRLAAPVPAAPSPRLAALADPTDEEAERALVVWLRHPYTTKSSFKAALAAFVQSRRSRAPAPPAAPEAPRTDVEADQGGVAAWVPKVNDRVRVKDTVPHPLEGQSRAGVVGTLVSLSPSGLASVREDGQSEAWQIHSDWLETVAPSTSTPDVEAAKERVATPRRGIVCIGHDNHAVPRAGDVSMWELLYGPSSWSVPPSLPEDAAFQPAPELPVSAAPAPDLAALERAVVDAAMAANELRRDWIAIPEGHNESSAKYWAFDTARETAWDTCDALRAALRPTPERDAVGEAVADLEAHLSPSSPVIRASLDRLRAALAKAPAAPETGHER